MLTKDEWIRRAAAAGSDARSRSAKGPARGRFEAWWEKKRNPAIYDLREAMAAAFVRAWLDGATAYQPPPTLRGSGGVWYMKSYEELTISAERYTEYHFDAAVSGEDAWRAWADILMLPLDRAKKLKREFVSAWTARADGEQDARDCAERERDRAERAADAADVRALAEMGEDE